VIAHVCHASRKDLRDAVEAARGAQVKWAQATAYNRGQVLYRMAEMMEGKRGEFVDILVQTSERQQVETSKNGKSASKRSAGVGGFTRAQAQREVAAAIDRLVCYGGWADKYAQVLGCNNPVAGPYYNFTTPEATGVTAVIAGGDVGSSATAGRRPLPLGASRAASTSSPGGRGVGPGIDDDLNETPALLSLITLMAAPLCAGNAVVVIADGRCMVPAAVLGEVCATADVPGGVVNMLTGRAGELIEHVAGHREIDAVHAAGLSAEQAKTLRAGAAENVKRVTVILRAAEEWFDAGACEHPWMIEPFVEMKTVWHPCGA